MDRLNRDRPPLPHARRLQDTEHRCPACGDALARYRAYRVEFEGCPRCRGIWLDLEKLRRLKDRAADGGWHNLRWMDDEIEAIEGAQGVLSDRKCPKCDDQRMVATTLGDSQVVVDVCPGCRGIWLDGEEFEEITAYLRDELDRMSPEEARAALMEELREVWHGPEGTVGELRDALAALGTLVNISIFEHPRLAEFLSRLKPFG